MSSRRVARLLAPVVALVVVAGACSNEPPAVVVSGNDPATAAKDLVETLEAEGFTILVSLLEYAELTDVLADGEGDETFTVFAPSDAAFGDLAPGLAEVLAGEEDVIAPAPTSAEPDENTAGGQAGTEETTAEEDAATEDEAATDDEAATEEAVATPISAELPSPEEVRELLVDILTHHVVEDTLTSEALLEAGTVTSIEGSPLEIDTREEPPATEGGEPTVVPTVNDVDISATDLLATNGVIHTVDAVLIPEDRVDDLEALVAAIPVTSDVMATLARTGEHTQLVAALESSGLDQTLLDAGAITLFAPTDDAFAALSADQLALLDDADALASLLGFHVFTRAVTPADVSTQESVATVEGQPLLFVKDGEDYTVEGVPVEDSIPTVNGVVHVIGEILVPDSLRGPGGL